MWCPAGCSASSLFTIRFRSVVPFAANILALFSAHPPAFPQQHAQDMSEPCPELQKLVSALNEGTVKELAALNKTCVPHSFSSFRHAACTCCTFFPLHRLFIPQQVETEPHVRRMQLLVVLSPVVPLDDHRGHSNRGGVGSRAREEILRLLEKGVWLSSFFSRLFSLSAFLIFLASPIAAVRQGPSHCGGAQKTDSSLQELLRCST